MSDINEMNVGTRWYVAHTYSGYEDKIKANLEIMIENRGLADQIFDIVIPTETKEIVNGQEIKEKVVKLFPGYVFIKMIMNDETWHVVRNITGVSGFVGPGSRPTPLEPEEVANLLLEGTRTELAFKVGDTVTMSEGLFAGTNAVVSEISEDKTKVTVLIKRGLRDMSVTVDATTVKRA